MVLELERGKRGDRGKVLFPARGVAGARGGIGTTTTRMEKDIKKIHLKKEQVLRQPRSNQQAKRPHNKGLKSIFEKKKGGKRRGNGGGIGKKRPSLSLIDGIWNSTGRL